MMGKKIKLNEITFGIMIKIFGFAHKLNSAFELLDIMNTFDIKPSIIIFTNLIHISFYNKKSDYALKAYKSFKDGGG